ncbi:unnamed protein product [Cylicocyclus nassatus]|uniref:6-phosphofructo-2-kinase domain-containing protein n=1 Tax=Cylicocyclus nassatus TaxID=53992 RepID=A0AA36DUH1_CYLNA|nr:unnamed protein product [Cylicocyclus nassatus]
MATAGVPQRKMTYFQVGGPDADANVQVRVPNVIALVGLPARGKTYISHKLCRYLNWIGIKTRAFNVGEYRRKACDLEKEGDFEFFSPYNIKGNRIREECARLAIEDMGQYLSSKEGEVAILDATNTTRARRRMVAEFCANRRTLVDPPFRVFFVESICDDPHIINSNITEVKINSPDYKGIMSHEEAKQDFLKRIENYKLQYEPLDEEEDEDLSFIKVINAGKSFYVHNVNGHVQSRVVYFLMNIHLLPRSIYLTRHGESEYNQLGRLGGDSPLSENGLKYAEKLKDYFESEDISDLRVWSSQRIRAAQTAASLKKQATATEYWKVLDEIDAGICEGLTYEDFQARYPKQFAERDKDKYHYRYPSGESYEDLVTRLEPVIMELERQSNILVISHQAVLRCILAYFTNKNTEELPYLRVPLHTVIKLTPKAYSCEVEMFKFDVKAVNTYREKNQPTCPYVWTCPYISVAWPYLASESFLALITCSFIVIILYTHRNGTHPRPGAEEVLENCNCVDANGNSYDFCYHLPENRSIHGRRFSCQYLPVIKKLGLLDAYRLTLTWKPSPPAFVTAFSDNHQDEALALVKSFAQYFSNQRMIVYDLGDVDLNLFKEWKFLEFRKFKFEDYPGYVRSLMEYRWKPLIIAKTLLEFGAIWYMDSSVVFKKGDLSHVYELVKCREIVKERPPLLSSEERDERENRTVLESGWEISQYRKNLAECRKVKAPNLTLLFDLLSISLEMLGIVIKFTYSRREFKGSDYDSKKQ